MLKKKERLNREDFNRFFSTGKKYQSPLFTLVYSPLNLLSVSVVVPKKVEKLAVNRNKTRRRVYDIVRRCRDRNKITGVFIFILKKSTTPYTHNVIKEEVEKFLQTTQNI